MITLKPNTLLLLTAILFSCFSVASEKRDIVVSVGEWAPFISHGLPYNGVLTHITLAAFEQTNIEPSFIFLEWNEAYSQARDTVVDASLGWVKDTKRETEFYFSDPIAFISTSFFHHQDLQFSWQNLKDLQALKMGVVLGYSYGQQFQDALEAGYLNILTYETEADAFAGLVSGQIDILPADELVGRSFLDTSHQRVSDLFVIDERPLEVTPLHLIVSRSYENSETLLTAFNKGLQAIKRSGRYANILKYRRVRQALAGIEFMTEDNPPINYLEDGRLHGVSVNVLRAILSELESQYVLDQIEVLPWARAYKRLQSEPNVALLSTVHSSERADQFEWVGPIHHSKVVLFAKKDWEYPKSDLSSRSICVVDEDVGAQLLVQNQHPQELLNLVAYPKLCVNMLAIGRVDLWAFGRETGWWQLTEQGHDHSEFEVIGQIHESSRYIAFSKPASEHVIRTFQEVLDLLILSGELQDIILKTNTPPLAQLLNLSR